MEPGAKFQKVEAESKCEGSRERELEKRLGEALEQQTAISEILRVISRFSGGVKPMLDAVAERALRLCDAADATIFLVEEDQLRFGSPIRQHTYSSRGGEIHASDSRFGHRSRRHRPRGDPRGGPTDGVRRGVPDWARIAGGDLVTTPSYQCR